jgi:hypothetical protein
MNLSAGTKSLLAHITEVSGNRMQRPLDVGRLIELAAQTNKQKELDDLAFFSKFLSKSFELMKRIGIENEGYEKLSGEFTADVEKSQALIRSLAEQAPKDVQAYFSVTYLTMNDNTMSNLMQLFYDLSWYKNYQIDSRQSSQ